MPTLQSLAERYGYIDLSVVFPELDIPVLTGPQRQGDVLMLPSVAPAKWPTTGPVPLDGVVVVDSEITAHTHSLYGDGSVLLTRNMTWQRAKRWQTAPNTLGWLRVPEGGEAFLMHSQEHGALGIGPGMYEIRQQMEYVGRLLSWLPVGD